MTGAVSFAAGRLWEPWQALYQGEDATGAHVIGLWQFQRGAPTNDSSRNGLHLRLQGAVVVEDERFGSCLESFRGHPFADRKHAAVVPNHPVLTPKGAFTVEMWIKPKRELEGYLESFLLDKKYVANADYQMVLSAPVGGGAARRLVMRLGFGDDSETYFSDPAVYEPGRWYHIAFTYDGAGEGRFYRDGVSIGGARKTGRGSIVAGRHPLHIGDRVGSYYHGFPGYMAQVRLCSGVLEFRPVVIGLVSERDVFVRMEKGVELKFAVSNLQRCKLKGAVTSLHVEGCAENSMALPELDAGATHHVSFPFDSALRPGEYKVCARIRVGGDKPFISEESFRVTVVPRRPARMPVLMWGVGGVENVLKELPRLKQIGFTHCLGMSADYAAIYEAGRPVTASRPETVAETKRMLNVALANDLAVCVSLSPGHWAERKKEFLRVDRNGRSDLQRPSICGLFPEMQKFCYNVGASVAQTYGEFPAWDAALLHTEVRDAAGLCYHEHDREACRRATGADIPAEVGGKWGVDYKKLKDFPPERVIPDDHPIYRYLKWYWKEGDGWNVLNTQLHRGLKTCSPQRRRAGIPEVWTFHDPAVRVASVYGSGGMVDVISHWTYSYPDPIRIGVTTDELFAMAGGAAHPQRVMKMTQIIWYRSQTCPAQKGDEVKKALKSPFEDTDPDRVFPTIAPMHLREAFWTKIARPIQGIMYHGWQSLVPVEGDVSAYRYTHPQTQHELRRLNREVVEPFGPTFLQVPDRKSDVAYLESFAAQVFARRGTYGWGQTWAGDGYQVLMWAQLQPEIVYDETVVERGLNGYRVLVMFDCDVLTATVAAKVREFQKQGGIVVGDERLCPAIKPDIVIQSYTRTRKADEDRAALIGRAAALRKALDRRYRRYHDSSNPDVVTRCRAYRTTDYLFAVNDKREFGNYVGQFGLVMENGLPSDATLSVQRARGFVYDLLAGRLLVATNVNDQVRFHVGLGPCEGRVFMITEEPIAGVVIEAPEKASLAESVICRVSVVGPAG
ncbi:MAG: LamG domain-containing protein, partial [Verrucomicrobiae bacterium]|nr:LamG domain-containing protein [Verrucomicrobiae bacterium]